jgi:hypothetical protein
MPDRKLDVLTELITANDDMQFLVDDNGVSKRIRHLNFRESASSILTKIKTVDGTGSGLDADTLQATQPTDLSLDGGYF